MEAQRDGNQTWVGEVSTPGSERSVIITFGKDATFGSLLSTKGKPLRLITQNGKTYIAQQDDQAAAERAQVQKLMPSPPIDYRLPPQVQVSDHAAAQTRAAIVAATSSTTTPTIDVLLGYTPGMVTALGSTSAVITRLNYLISVANQAYSDSQVNSRVRLVGTVAVNYPDASDDNQVLDDLTNNSPAGPLASLRARRKALGADLVSLVRPFSKTGQGGLCGLGYLNGANLAPFTVASAPYGYSTIGDGSDSGSYCLDITLAHEMGHNMGLAHDQADASGPGAFTYAYGWRQTLTTGSFFTIMAYGTGNQQSVPYFADPNITLCNGNPCGDPIQANQTLALNQTMPVVAAFNAPGEPTSDINGDGMADIVMQNTSTGQYAYMLMQGSNPIGNKVASVAAGYRIAAVADLSGNGSSDLIWTSAANDLYFWINNGSGSYSSVQGPSYSAGWTLVGTGDINGDGTADLLWINNSTHQFSYWLMNGATVVSTKIIPVTPGYYIAAIGDFTGSGYVDLVWTSAANDLYFWMNNGAGAFTSARGLDYPAGWQLVGSGDINGDQRADLIWTNDSTHQFAYWLMNGSTRTGYQIMPISAGYHVAAIDRFSGGTASILWTSSANDLYLWQNNGSGAFNSSQLLGFPASQPGYYYQDYPAGWSVLSNSPVRP
ncbi:hypothetical protein B0E50_05355 [Rhodanobacter sp. C01]|nr:hypothetical protein B0E50_05355 [Rhodanobacter sp. C01]